MTTSAYDTCRVPEHAAKEITLLTLVQASHIVDETLAYARRHQFAPLTVAVLDMRGCVVALKMEDGSSLVQILEVSGLVRTQKLGRTRTCSLNPAPLRSAERWISARRAFVERRLDRLGQYLAETTETTDTPTNAERPGPHPSEEESS
jgi:hypothetical protein